MTVPGSLFADGDGMTDLEITKLCAKAMGFRTKEHTEIFASGLHYLVVMDVLADKLKYDPLNDDEQAMALAKHFWLSIQPPQYDDCAMWHVWRHPKPNYTTIHGRLNRAICECVAKMQAAR